MRWMGLALVGALVWGSVARAETRVLPLVHSGGPGAEKAAVLAAEALRRQVARDPRYTLVHPGAQFGLAKVGEARKQLKAAAALVRQSRSAYESFELERAVIDLNRAVRIYSSTAAYTPIDDAVGALMLLAASHILLGEEKTGARRLREALTLDPQAEPDPRIFNPPMRRIFKEVSAVMITEGRGVISLQSNPSYARVYVDDTFVGVTPLLVEDVVPGQHYVRLEKDGYSNWGRVVSVAARAEQRQTGQLQRDPGYDDFEGLEEQAFVELRHGPKGVATYVDQLGVITQADHILLGELRLDGDRARLEVRQFEVATKRLVAHGERTFPYSQAPTAYDQEISELYKRVFATTSVPADPSKQKVTPVESGALSPTVLPGSALEASTLAADCDGFFCDRGRLWGTILAGSAVAMAGAGAGLWAVANDRNNAFEATAQRDAASEHLRSEGRAFALGGDVLMIAGGAAAVGGIFAFMASDAPNATVSQVRAEGAAWQMAVAPMQHGVQLAAAGHF